MRCGSIFQGEAGRYVLRADSMARTLPKISPSLLHVNACKSAQRILGRDDQSVLVVFLKSNHLFCLGIFFFLRCSETPPQPLILFGDLTPPPHDEGKTEYGGTPRQYKRSSSRGRFRCFRECKHHHQMAVQPTTRHSAPVSSRAPATNSFGETNMQQARRRHLHKVASGCFPVEAVSWQWPCLCQALQLCPAVCQVER